MPQNEYIERWQKLHGKRYAPPLQVIKKAECYTNTMFLGWMPTRRPERRPRVRDTNDRRMHRICEASGPRCSSSSAIRRRSRCGRGSRHKRSGTSNLALRSSRRPPFLTTCLIAPMLRMLRRCPRLSRIGGMRRLRSFLSPFRLFVVSRRRKCLRLLLRVKRLIRRLGRGLLRSPPLLDKTLREGRRSLSGLFGMYCPFFVLRYAIC